MSTMTFQPVNPSSAQRDYSQEVHDDAASTPSTPRAGATHIPMQQDMGGSGQDITTTVLSTFSTTQNLPGQKPLPTSPFAISTKTETDLSLLQRGGSQISVQASRNTEDMDVDDSDDDQVGSDNDLENGETARSSKKKKGQRFFCTDFPPCNLSFTRSEHLARHIRKHTGERPFQCHCNRKFSRLDNLRQHAQTVHVNEDIPAESLAATGTRYQRQIRTEKLRPTGGRSRSGTLSSQGGHARGHSRNLSASSIGSTTSNYSTTENRRRPPPLLMATDVGARPQPALDRPRTPPSQYGGYSTNSPGGLTTPTSATYSANPVSPGYGLFLESPVTANSRTLGLYGTRTPGRRLSVPSSVKTFPVPHGHSQSNPYMSPPPASTSHYSNNHSPLASPVASNSPYDRIECSITPAEAELRRRTWHPSSYAAAGFNYPRPATSGLSFSQTPDALYPALMPQATAAAGQAPRLPGIESFDQVQHRPCTPPRRQPSPMQLDTPRQQPPPFVNHNTFHRHAPLISDHRRGHFSWDGTNRSPSVRPGLQTNLSRDAASWSQQTLNEIQNAALRPIVPTPAHPAYRAKDVMIQDEAIRQSLPEAPLAQPTTPQRNKRHGWYHAPPSATTQSYHISRKSPDDSSSSDGVATPGASAAAEVHPAIMHSNGYIEPHHAILPVEAQADTCIPHPAALSNHPAPPREQGRRRNYLAGQPSSTNDMGRLEALVAVATNEDTAATVAR